MGSTSRMAVNDLEETEKVNYSSSQTTTPTVPVKHPFIMQTPDQSHDDTLPTISTKDKDEALECIAQLLEACGDRRPSNLQTMEVLYDMAIEFLEGVAYGVSDKSTRNPDNLMDTLFKDDPVKWYSARQAHVQYKENRDTKKVGDVGLSSLRGLAQQLQ
ncbi:hypothetical protein GEMRC1_003187 [Eukaryota sp. GEM-RC1]